MAAAIIVIALDSEESERPRKRKSGQRSGFYNGALITDTLAFSLRIKEPVP